MEDFVNFEIAKKLKEKGFPQSPDYFNYSSYYEWDGLRKIHSLSNASVWFDPNISRDNIYFAPTISQVLKWLREEKKIVISIFPHPCGWQADIYKDVHEYYDSEAECYLIHYYKEKTEISHSYNWLEIYCIQYVLDNLI